MFKRVIACCTVAALALSVAGCNTLEGAGEDAKAVGQATGEGIEAIGEGLQDISE